MKKELINIKGYGGLHPHNAHHIRQHWVSLPTVEPAPDMAYAQNAAHHHGQNDGDHDQIVPRLFFHKYLLPSCSHRFSSKIM